MRERDVRVRGKKPSQVSPEHVHAFLNSPVYTRAFEFPDFTNKCSLSSFSSQNVSLYDMPQLKSFIPGSYRLFVCLIGRSTLSKF